MTQPAMRIPGCIWWRLLAEVRVNFLNWRPDQDEFNTDGLQVADNVLHDVEGYKQLLMRTAGASGTQTGLSSAISFREASIGTGGQTMKCWLRKTANTSLTLTIAVNPITTLGTAASATLSSQSGAITSFSVAELDDNIFVTAEAEVHGISGPEYLNLTGYVAFNP